MAEWSKAPALKSGDVKSIRGFESHSLRQKNEYGWYDRNLRLWRCMVVGETGILCWLVCQVRDDTGTFRELNMPVLGV